MRRLLAAVAVASIGGGRRTAVVLVSAQQQQPAQYGQPGSAYGAAPEPTPINPAAPFQALTLRAAALSRCGQATVSTCATLGYDCGVAEGTCGTLLSCGVCTAPHHFCRRNVCTCTPTSCEEQGVRCGPLDDRCGRTLQCGTCERGTACTAGRCTGCDGRVGGQLFDQCGVCGGDNTQCELTPRLGVRWRLYPQLDAYTDPAQFKSVLMHLIERVLASHNASSSASNATKLEAELTVEFPEWQQNTSAIATVPQWLAPARLNATGPPPAGYAPNATKGGRMERLQFRGGVAELLRAPLSGVSIGEVTGSVARQAVTDHACALVAMGGGAGGAFRGCAVDNSCIPRGSSCTGSAVGEGEPTLEVPFVAVAPTHRDAAVTPQLKRDFVSALASDAARTAVCGRPHPCIPALANAPTDPPLLAGAHLNVTEVRVAVGIHATVTAWIDEEVASNRTRELSAVLASGAALQQAMDRAELGALLTSHAMTIEPVRSATDEALALRGVSAFCRRWDGAPRRVEIGWPYLVDSRARVLRVTTGGIFEVK
jgi:hypothetical protein